MYMPIWLVRTTRFSLSSLIGLSMITNLRSTKRKMTQDHSRDIWTFPHWRQKRVGFAYRGHLQLKYRPLFISSLSIADLLVYQTRTVVPTYVAKQARMTSFITDLLIVRLRQLVEPFGLSPLLGEQAFIFISLVHWTWRVCYFKME